jgi:hypothetical protein
MSQAKDKPVGAATRRTVTSRNKAESAFDRYKARVSATSGASAGTISGGRPKFESPAAKTVPSWSVPPSMTGWPSTETPGLPSIAQSLGSTFQLGMGLLNAGLVTGIGILAGIMSRGRGGHACGCSYEHSCGCGCHGGADECGCVDCCGLYRCSSECGCGGECGCGCQPSVGSCC